MTDRERVLKLMYMAFLDIRTSSHSQDNRTCFVLSDVFHTIPLQMNQADKGKMRYSDIIVWIQKKCEERKCTLWLENAQNHIARLPE